MAEKIKAYMMRVDEETGQVYKGYMGEIKNTLEAKQKYVNFDKPNGLIQVVCIEGIDIICHDEGKLLQYPANRVLMIEDEVADVFCGNILAVRHNDEGEFISILPEDIVTINKFLKPVYKVGTKLIIIPSEDWLEDYKETSI